MESSQLRYLFEAICDHLDAIPQGSLNFVQAYGVESREEAVMVFVFQEGVFVCRFGVARVKKSRRDIPAISADECLQMVTGVRQCQGGFEQLFQ
ncbi:MAG: hypothetical protein Q8P95_05285 [bacterium]|nr:hypothetical protein [bacterium]